MKIATALPATIARAVESLRRGGLVILVDSHDREDEADLIASGEKMVPATVNFMVTHGRGLLCVSIDSLTAQRVGLTTATVKNPRILQHCNFTESIDAYEGITTGISAKDRAHTIALLASEKSSAKDFSTPGHVFPLIARDGGVLERPGHTEGTMALLKIAKLKPVGALCEIMDADGTMLRGKALIAYAKKHKLPICSIEEIAEYERARTVFVKKEVTTPLPTEKFGELNIIGYRGIFDDKDHLAVIVGSLNTKKPVLLRMHSECLTGDVFGSIRCDCNKQLFASLEAMKQEGGGVLLYLRHEGRGIGLINKLKAYNLQDDGLDTYEANVKLGFKADARSFEVARDMIRDLGITKVRLMTNNPEKIEILEKSGISVVERVPLVCKNAAPLLKRYLSAKKKRAGHLL